MDAYKELVRRLFERAFNERELDLCDHLVADDYVEHAIVPFGTSHGSSSSTRTSR